MLADLGRRGPLAPVRAAAGRAIRSLFPTPEVGAWRAAVRHARRQPRYVPGEVLLGGYRIAYTDALTLCPSWKDIFVDQVLRFSSAEPAPRVIDCGANIGLAALYARRLYPSARVTAFEADPQVADACRRNMRNNGCADVDVRQAAVWIDNGAVAFAAEGADAGAVAALGTGVAGRREMVPSVRLRDVLAAEPRVDLLKIDIEGAEYDVLGDCADMLGAVRALLLDVHEFDASARRVPGLLELLARSGFAYSLDHLMPVPWRGMAPATSPFAGTHTAYAALVRAWRP